MKKIYAFSTMILLGATSFAQGTEGFESQYSNIVRNALTNKSPSKGVILDIRCQSTCSITQTTQGASYSYPDAEYEVVSFEDAKFQPVTYSTGINGYSIGANSVARHFGTTEYAPRRDITGQLRENPPAAGAFAVPIQRLGAPNISNVLIQEFGNYVLDN